MRHIRYALTLPRPMLPAQAAVLEAIPGVDLRHVQIAAPMFGVPVTPQTSVLYVPPDLARIVAEHLIGWGVEFKHQPEWTGPVDLNPQGQVVAPEDIPEMRPEMVARLKPFQREGLTFCQGAMGAMAHWSCGSGKTALGVMFSLSHRGLDGGPGRTVIVTRATTKHQWAEQYEKWAHGVRTHVIEGVCGWRAEAASATQVESGSLPWKLVNADLVGFGDEPSVVSWHATKEEVDARVNGRRMTLSVPEDVRVLIVSWEILAERVYALKGWSPQTVIYDESHRAKSNIRWRAVPEADGTTSFERRDNQSAAAMVLASAPRVLLLTATPAPDRTRDLWSQLDLISPFSFGKFRGFALRYCSGFDGKYGFDSTGSSNKQELAERLHFHVHHVTKDRTHAELPPLRRVVEHIPVHKLSTVRPSQQEWKAKKRAGAQAMLEYKIALAAEMKREYALEQVQEALEDGLHVVLLTGRISAAQRLQKAIQAAIGKQTEINIAHVGKAATWVATGQGDTESGTSAAERRDIIAAYNAHAGPAFLVGTIDALGEAIDGLEQTTDVALILAVPWNFGKATQAEGRFHRLSMPAGRNPIVKYVIAAGTIDETIEEAVLQKLDGVGEVLDDEDARKLNAEFMGLGPGGDATDIIAQMAAKLLLGSAANLDDETFEKLKFDFSPEAQRLASTGTTTADGDELTGSAEADESPAGFADDMDTFKGDEGEET